MRPAISARPVEHDDVLFARARRGDSVAFAALVTRYWNAVHHVGWNMLPGKDAAAEVAEATFLSALHGEDAFASGLPFRTALFRAAMRNALKRVVAPPGAATRALGIFLPRFDTHGRLVTSGTDWTRAASAAFGQEDVADAIREILLRLDVLDRAAFVLRVVEELPAEETAAVLGIASEAVRHRTHRASLILTGFLGQLVETSRTTRLC